MRPFRLLLLAALLPTAACTDAAARLSEPVALDLEAALVDTSRVSVRRITASDFELEFDSWSSSVFADGSGIVTTDWMTGDIAIFDFATAQIRGITLNDEPYDRAMAQTFAPSANGSRVAFGKLDFKTGYAALSLGDIASGESRVLFHTSVPRKTFTAVAWTPAGDSIYGLEYGPGSSDVKVLLIPAVGGEPRHVHTIASPGSGNRRMSLSPDGQWLLYNHTSGGDRSRGDVHIIDTRAGTTRAFIDYPSDDHLVGWLPGSEYVLFRSDRGGTTGLWAVRASGGRPAGEPRLVRPDFFLSEGVGFGGGALFYTVQTGSRDAFVVGFDPAAGGLTGDAPRVTRVYDGNLGGVAWSPDGRALATLIRDPGSQLVRTQSLATGETRDYRLGAEIEMVTAISWAADGTSILIRTGSMGTEHAHLLHLDLASGATRSLFSVEQGREFRQFFPSPDGRLIVFHGSSGDGPLDRESFLAVRPLDGGPERVIYRTRAGEGFIKRMALSADGRSVAVVMGYYDFDAGRVAATDSIMVMPVDGPASPRALRAVALADRIDLVGWYAGGDALLISRWNGPGEDQLELHRLSLDGTMTRAGSLPTRSMHVSMSPTGDRLAYAEGYPRMELWRMDGLDELFADLAAGSR